MHLRLDGGWQLLRVADQDQPADVNKRAGKLAGQGKGYMSSISRFSLMIRS